VIEAAARLGKMPTRKAAAEFPAPAKAAAHMAAAESATHMAATTTETAAHMAAATTEAATHMSAATTTETSATVSSPTTTATSPAARKRVSGHSPGESGSRSQNDHDLPQHCTTPSDATVHSIDNIVTTVRLDCAIRSMTVDEEVVPSFRVGMGFIADQVHAIACTRPQPPYQ
jgi:hypothetical protein